jgi:amino acid adenylation domain-containing protein/non-ribosomal peptide synthase protein (TIGR01720 family)
MNITHILDVCEANEISLKVVGDNLKVVSKAGRLNDDIKLLLKNNKATIIEMLRASQSDDDDRIPALYSGEPDADYALSFAQQRMWFAYQLDPTSASHNMAAAYAIDGELNIEALEKALQQLIDRHSTLRTRFVATADGRGVQRIRERAVFSLARRDLSDLPEEAAQARLEELALAEAELPFDLGEDLMLRATLIRLGADRHVLLVTQHHIASDGWSLELLMRDIAAFYHAALSGQPASLPALPIHYVDYAVWQRSRLQGDFLENKMRFWRDMLTGAPQTHSLPLDKPRPKRHDSRGRVFQLALERDLGERVSQLALAAGVSNYMVYYAAYAFMVARLGGTHDVVIGSPIANRAQLATENLAGYFANTIAIRFDVDEPKTVRDLLNQTKYKLLAAQENQDVPFELVVEDLNPERNLSHSPIFQLVINYHALKDAQMSDAGLSIQPVALEHTTCNFDLVLKVDEYPSGTLLKWEYAAALLNEQTVRSMAESYRQCLAEFCSKLEASLDEISLLSPEAERHLLDEIVLASKPGDDSRCFHHLVEDIAKRFGDRTAVVAGECRLSYSQLNARANQLAASLQAHGLGTDDLVGVFAERSAEMIIALLGILKSGAAYLPIDPKHPTARLEHIIADASARLVIGRSDGPAAALSVPCLPMEELDPAATGFLDAFPDGELAHSPATGPDDTAYAIYTSGSTGLPKGVALRHRGLVNLALATTARFGIDEHTRMLQFSSFTFDAATWDFAQALAVGAELHLVDDKTIGNPERVGRYVKEQGITYCFFTPSLLNTLRLEDFHGVTTLVVGGEAVSLELVRKWAKGRRFFNAYGPTENTVVATCQQLDESAERVTIGTGIDNVACFVLDSRGRLVPDGVIGELCVAGVGVAKGYINNPELTEQKFIANHFSGLYDSRFYKTGDLVRRLPSGQFEFHGRIDDQVKIRGFRIELGEIEHQLRQSGLARDLAVVVNTREPANPKLVAYVCPQAGGAADRSGLADALRERAQQTLPYYMVPAAFVVLDKLPLNSSGKLDRKNLPDPAIDSVKTRGFVAPRNPIEVKLCQCWEAVLGVAPVGIEDNFFALGGDSILCLQLVARAKEMGIKIAVEDIFEYQTIAELARIQVRHQEPAPQEPSVGTLPLMPIQQYFLAGNRDMHYFNQSVILGVPEGFDETCLRQSLTHLYNRHDALRLVFPTRNGQWVAEFQPLSEEWLDLSIRVAHLDAAAAADPAVVRDHCVRLQEEMDIGSGPLVRAAYFKAQQHVDSRLVLIIHHLVVDAVSWRILLDDLSSCFRQWRETGAIKLGEKTNSFQQWSQALVDYTHSAELSHSRAFWKQQISGPVDTIRPDWEVAEPTYGTTGQILRKLDTTATRELLTLAGRNNASQMNNLLLAALGLACREWQGLTSVAVTMESHGRDTAIKRMDLSQTVGWFTAMYPLRLPTVDAQASEAGVEAQLSAVNALVEEAADKLIDYGVLRYIVRDPALDPAGSAKPCIVFNYLGQGDQVKTQQAFEVVNQDIGPATSPNRVREHLLDFKVVVANGELCVVVAYSQAQFAAETIARFAELYIANLQSVIGSCRMNTEESEAPDDLPVLTKVASDVPVPVGFFQQMMLEGLELGAVDTTLRIPFHWRIRGALNSEALQRALREIFRRHPALGCGFERAAEGFRFVTASAELAIIERDWTQLADVETALQYRVDEMTAEGFDLRHGPMMRCELIHLGAEDHALLCLFHHVVFDGWSMRLVKRELQALYQSYAGGAQPVALQEPAVSMLDYAHWQRALANTADYQRRLQQVRQNLAIGGPQEKVAADNPRSAEVSREFKSQTLYFDADTVAKLSAFAAQEGVTNYTIFLLAFRLSLYLYSRQPELLLASPQADREQPEVQGTVGAFLNWMVVKLPVREGSTLFEYFLRGKQIVAEAFRNRGVNIFAATEGLENRVEFHDVISSLQFQYLDGLNHQDDQLQLVGLSVSNLSGGESAAANHTDLSAVVLKNDDKIRCELYFNCALFNRDTAGSILQTMKKIVGLLVNSDDRKIDKI